MPGPPYLSYEVEQSLRRFVGTIFLFDKILISSSGLSSENASSKV